MNVKLLLGSVLLLVCGGAQGATIFAQTPSVDTAFCADPSSGGFCTAKNQAAGFAPSTSGVVDTVVWRGSYIDFGLFTCFNCIGDREAPVPTSDGFVIEFWTDAAGQPGTLIQSFAIHDDDTTTDTGLDVTFPDPFDRDQTFSLYEHTASLGTGISLTSGTNYWIAISNDAYGSTFPENGYHWSWAGDLDGSNDLWYLGGDGLGPTTTWDRAWNDRTAYFELSVSPEGPGGPGGVVPVPSAIWLFASALGFFGWMRRSAKQLR